jgi:hypothetical protein
MFLARVVARIDDFERRQREVGRADHVGDVDRRTRALIAHHECEFNLDERPVHRGAADRRTFEREPIVVDETVVGFRRAGHRSHHFGREADFVSLHAAPGGNFQIALQGRCDTRRRHRHPDIGSIPVPSNRAFVPRARVPRRLV